MKKAWLIAITLLLVVFAYAESVGALSCRSITSPLLSTRTEVAAYQETFETGAPGWTFSPLTGTNQLWHVDTVTDAPSPTHAMINQNANGTYNPGMSNYLISPNIMLPLSGAIKADFMMKGDFTDPHYPNGTVNQLDYWGWQISVLNGTTWSAWYNMTNPYTTAAGYIFIDAPTEWAFVTESYTGLDGLISNYAGMTVRFRVYFKSDTDTPDGSGIMIDNFTIFNDIFLPAPTSLAAAVAGQTVNLTWNAPPSGFSSQTITSTNSAWTSYVSDGEAYAMKIANPFDAPLQLHGVKFMLYRGAQAPIGGSPSVHVYAEAGGLPDIELIDVPGITNIPNGAWKEVDISSYNIMIPANGNVFVGVSGVDGDGAGDQGLLCDSTSTNADSYVLNVGNWDTLGNTYGGLRNCALAGTYWVEDPFAPILTGFKVYRGTNVSGPFDLISTISSPTIIDYNDATPVLGQVNYYQVTGVFQNYESDPSNQVFVDLITFLYTELLVDDGTADQDYTLATAATMATKFTTDPDANIRYVRVFLNAVGNSALVIRVFDNNGAGGAPGTQLTQFLGAVTSLTTGWNNLPLPVGGIITDPDGIFFIGVVEYGSAPTFTLDTSSNGMSWKKLTTTSEWLPITEGNVMIRALVDWGPIANDDPTSLAPVSSLTSYPNPFSRNTQLSFELTKSAEVNVNIYNLKGQLVRSLSAGLLAKGSHQVSWDGQDNKGNRVSAGVYFTRVETSGLILTRKLICIQ